MRLRVLTMNVQNTEGPPERQRIPNGLLRRHAPDVVSLQEVASTDQLDALLAGTGLHGTHQSQVLLEQPPYVDRYGGTAVATRRPHRVVEVLDQRLADAPDVPWYTLARSCRCPSSARSSWSRRRRRGGWTPTSTRGTAAPCRP